MHTKWGNVVLFTGDNYPAFERSAKIALHVASARKIADGTEPRPGGPNANTAASRDWDDRNARAIQILTSVKPAFHAKILEAVERNDPKAVWDELTKLNRNANTTYNLRVREQFNSTTLDPAAAQSIRSLSTLLLDLQLQLSSTSLAISDAEVAARLIAALPSEGPWLQAKNSAFQQPQEIESMVAYLQEWEFQIESSDLVA